MAKTNRDQIPVDLNDIDKSKNLDELLQNYLKFMISSRTIIETTIQSLNIVNEKKIKLPVNVLGEEKLILNIEAIINQLPKAIVNYLVEQNTIMLRHLKPTNAASYIYTNAQSTYLLNNSDENFVMLRDFSTRAHAELLIYIMQSLFDKTGSYHDVKGTGVLALFGDATIDIGNNRHLVINKDKITITDDIGDIIYSNNIGFEQIADCVIQNMTSFIEKISANGDKNSSQIKLSEIDWTFSIINLINIVNDIISFLEKNIEMSNKITENFENIFK